MTLSLPVCRAWAASACPTAVGLNAVQRDTRDLDSCLLQCRRHQPRVPCTSHQGHLASQKWKAREVGVGLGGLRPRQGTEQKGLPSGTGSPLCAGAACAFWSRVWLAGSEDSCLGSWGLAPGPDSPLPVQSEGVAP